METLGYVATHHWKDAEGVKSAREEVERGLTLPGGTGVANSGEERKVRRGSVGEVKFLEPSAKANTSGAGTACQGRRGSEEPVRSLALSSMSSAGLANLERGRVLLGDER